MSAHHNRSLTALAIAFPLALGLVVALAAGGDDGLLVGVAVALPLATALFVASRSRSR
jgi:hypothetical protein